MAEKHVRDVGPGPRIPDGGTAFPDAHSSGSGSLAFMGGLMEDNAARRLAEIPATGGIGNGFLVDPERAEQAVRTLTGVIDELEVAILAWRRQEKINAGTDPVSVQLAENVATMGTRAGSWLESWTDQIRLARDALQAQVDDYRRVEQENADRFA